MPMLNQSIAFHCVAEATPYLSRRRTGKCMVERCLWTDYLSPTWLRRSYWTRTTTARLMTRTSLCSNLRHQLFSMVSVRIWSLHLHLLSCHVGNLMQQEKSKKEKVFNISASSQRIYKTACMMRQKLLMLGGSMWLYVWPGGRLNGLNDSCSAGWPGHKSLCQ